MVALIRRMLLITALLAVSTALGQGERASEAQVKAAFLYKFGGFVEWPVRAFARTESAFAIGVLGADAVATELEQLTSGRTVQGRPITVQRLKRGEPVTGLHVLFVGQSEAARLGETLSAAKGQPLLVVTETEDALTRGSMINFITVEDKVRFDVALPQAERGQLKISSRLLAVARKVITS
jgi:uncharacterized protein DUF4154